MELQNKAPFTLNLFIHERLSLNDVYPLTFKDDIQVIGCFNCVTTPYVDELDVIFAGVGINDKSPNYGHKNL